MNVMHKTVDFVDALRQREEAARNMVDGQARALDAKLVSHPAHGGDTTYEAIKVIRAWGHDKSFCIGSALKYLARAGKKEGEPILRDLKKAAWYLAEEIRALEEAQVADPMQGVRRVVMRLAQEVSPRVTIGDAVDGVAFDGSSGQGAETESAIPSPPILDGVVMKPVKPCDGTPCATDVHASCDVKLCLCGCVTCLRSSVLALSAGKTCAVHREPAVGCPVCNAVTPRWLRNANFSQLTGARALLVGGAVVPLEGL